MLHLWGIHCSGITRYHSKMMSAGKGLRFINYKTALSPHQWPSGTCPSTISSPPTFEFCHSSCGVLILCKYPSIYSLWMKIMNDTSHHHLSKKYLALGITYGREDKDSCAWYSEGMLDGVMRKMVWKTTVQWIVISVEINIRKILLVQKNWRIESIPFVWRKFRPTGYHSKGIEGAKRWL